jgi:hypothetical protein
MEVGVLVEVVLLEVVVEELQVFKELMELAVAEVVDLLLKVMDLLAAQEE